MKERDSLLRRLVPDPIRKRYLAKFASIVVLVVLATAVAGFYFQGQVSAELTHEIHNEMETVAQLEADAMHEWVQEHEQNVRMLSEMGAMTSGDSDEIRAQFDHEKEQLPGTTHAIHYVNLESGTVEQSTTDGMVGENIDSLELNWAHGSLDFDERSEVAVSEGYENDGTELVAFVSPVEGTDKAVMLTVDAAERAEHFRNPIEGGYTQVVNSEGTIEFAEKRENVLTAYQEGAEATVVTEGANESGAFDRDGTDEVVAYAPVEGTDWVVVAHAPQSNAYTLRSTVTNDFIILVAIALLGFIFIGATTGRNTVNVLKSLEGKALAIASGDVDTEIPETGRIDEVGRVQDAFSQTQTYLDTVANQADALAKQDFEDPVLNEDVPGALGTSLQQMQTDLDEFIVELEQAKAEAQESRAQAEELAESLEQQAIEFGEVMEKAADGDLTQRLDTDLTNEAMADIARAFNEMLAQLEQTVVQIQRFSDEVAGASDEVATGSEEVEDASEQVARSIEEISEVATRQNENLQQVSGEMTDLSATVEEIASSSDEVATVSEQAADRGEEGGDLASESVNQMREIEDKTAETVDEIEQLDTEMERIGDILELIEEIAEQTNMLALNASIEAARAGEAGEGFGVVADEIKSLAEETHDATQEIEQLITDVQTSTGEAAADMREMRDLVGDGMATIEDSITALEDIVGHVEDANAGVQSINEATDEQAASTQEVVSMVDEVADLSENASEEAQNVSAAAEEQTASVTQIANNAQTLTEQADQLQRMVAAFDVSDTDVTVGMGDQLTAPGSATEQAAADGRGRGTGGDD